MKFAAAFSVISSAALAAAQAAMTMNTPTGVMECYNTLLTWTGPGGPYQITVLPGGQPNAVPLETLPMTNDTQQTWQCKEKAGTSVFFHLKKLDTGATVDSGAVTIQTGNPAMCGAASSGSDTSVPPATSVAGTTPPTPQTSAPATAPGTTPAVTGPANTNTGTTKAQSSNSSKTSSGAATAPTTQGGGAGQHQAPIALLAGAAAFVMALFA